MKLIFILKDTNFDLFQFKDFNFNLKIQVLICIFENVSQ